MNAKQELIKKLEDIGKTIDDIVAINISKAVNWDEVVNVLRTIRVVNLESLDFIYDNGYGRQELFGSVLFNDGSWLERHVYDGAESWRHITPMILDDVLA